MASNLDWVSIAQRIEALYPRATGGSTGDEGCRQMLVPWVNDVFKEITRIRRWTRSYSRSSFVTVQGTQEYGTGTNENFGAYTNPALTTGISNVWRVGAAGEVIPLRRFSPQEMRRAYGQGTVPPQGPPIGYSLALHSDDAETQSMALKLYPIPDNSGPDSGNYTIWLEGYFDVPNMVEVVGTTTTGGSAVTLTLTTNQGTWLQGLEVQPTSNSKNLLSVRGAGYAGKTHVTGWSGIGASSVTMLAAAQTVVTSAQVFFYSRNWIIHYYPKAVLFGVLREVAWRFKDDYKSWESRFQHELDLMADAEFDLQHEQEMFLIGSTGQNQSELRALDPMLGWEVRGGVFPS